MLLAALALVLAGCSANGAQARPDGGKLLVYTSFYPLYDFAGKVGGERIELVNLVPAGEEPHDWEPGTNDMVGLEHADLFIYNGAGMEHWAESLLASLGNDLHVVEASAGLAVSGDSGVDPHVWLSPVLALEQMRAIKDALVELDPDGEAHYEENFTVWSGRFGELDAAYRERLDPLPNRRIVVAHAAFGYLCSEYGLEQIAAQGFSPDSEPDPATMARVVSRLRGGEVRVIFFEELASPKVAEAIAREIGADTAVLYTIEGLTPEQEAAGEDYVSLMEENLEQLYLALA